MVPNYDVGDKEEEGIKGDSGGSGPNIWGTDVTINIRKENRRNSARKSSI